MAWREMLSEGNKRICCGVHITWEVTWMFAFPRFSDYRTCRHEIPTRDWIFRRLRVVKPQQLQSDATTNNKKLRGLLEPNRELYLPQILLKVGILLFELWIKEGRVNFILSRVKVASFKRNKHFLSFTMDYFHNLFCGNFSKKNFEGILISYKLLFFIY